MAQQGFLGEIRMFAGNFAPRSWAICEGQLLPIAQNTALFSILGTIYGGDGRTTFALPDLRGRCPISSGTGPGLPSYRQGSRAGQATHILNLLELPSHNHPTVAGPVTGEVVIGSNVEVATSAEASGSSLGEAGANIYNSDPAEASEKLAGVTHNLQGNVTVLNTGNSQSHNNMQPYLAINYIVAIQGTFPSRN